MTWPAAFKEELDTVELEGPCRMELEELLGNGVMEELDTAELEGPCCMELEELLGDGALEELETLIKEDDMPPPFSSSSEEESTPLPQDTSISASTQG